MADSVDRFRPLLVLAQAYQREYQWHEAARLQEEALRLARSLAREAPVRHQIGRRLFDEARYKEAAAELEWAHDLYRTARRLRLAGVSRQALNRARETGRQSRLRRKSIEIRIEDDVIKHLIAKGFDPVFGARSLRRVIRTQVAATVTDCILGASAQARQHPLKVLVHTADEQIGARLHDPEKP